MYLGLRTFLVPSFPHSPQLSTWNFLAFRRLCILIRARCSTRLWKRYLGLPGASWTGTPLWRGWLHARRSATALRDGWRDLGRPSRSSKRSVTMSAADGSCCRALTMMRMCTSASCPSTLRSHSEATIGASTSASAVTTPS